MNRDLVWVLISCCSSAAASCAVPGMDTGLGKRSQAGTTSNTGGAAHNGGNPSLGGNATAGGTSSAGGNATTAITNTPTGGLSSTGGASSGNSIGGTSMSGGSNTQGSSTPGGTTAVGTATGGTSSGGTVNTAASSLLGGTNAIGGTVSANGGKGGTSASGGSAPTGGAAALGGASSAGGTIVIGGSTPNGGTAAIGGTTTSGTTATGGTTTAGGTSAVGGSAGTGCTGSHESIQSVNGQGLCVAHLVIVGVTGAQFGIDATEVTRGQYEGWVATNPPLPASTDVNCGWKASGSYAAPSSCTNPAWPVPWCTVDPCDHYPQTCVDWCDANAYCAAVGKRLCGKIGGGSNAYEDYANAAKSQWYDACSSNGVNLYPYSNSYSLTACNGNDYWSPSPEVNPLPVGTLTTCQSSTQGYQGVYDLSGNVSEMEDACYDTGRSSYCRVGGGTFGDVDVNLPCNGAGIFVRYASETSVGFRCCSSP
jgi:formylglycine-generating enzyme